MIQLLRWVTRVAGLAALAIGIAFLFGSGIALVRLHMTLGIIVAGALAALAIWALSVRVRVPAAVVSLVWAVVVFYVGMTWVATAVVEVVHPLLGIGAIGLAEMLAASLLRRLRV